MRANNAARAASFAAQSGLHNNGAPPQERRCRTKAGKLSGASSTVATGQARSTSPLRGLLARGYFCRFISLSVHCGPTLTRSPGVRAIEFPPARLPYKSYFPPCSIETRGIMKTARLVIMGVSGSGKTTTGQAIARQLDLPFVDGDDLHPAENKAKMASGTPLPDVDRDPWLRSASGAALAIIALFSAGCRA